MSVGDFSEKREKKKNMNKNPGKKWPIIILGSIFGIVLASVATIVVAMDNPVEMSDLGMQGYHEYDANANEIIASKIKFDKSYTITYSGQQLDASNAVLRYKVTEKSGKPVNDAKINVVLTRPNSHADDIALDSPTVAEGVYTFDSVVLPKEGRWDIMANVVVGDKQRYYNLKADTRYPNVFEY
jgi:nitrogen fixation protein FixH